MPLRIPHANRLCKATKSKLTNYAGILNRKMRREKKTGEPVAVNLKPRLVHSPGTSLDPRATIDSYHLGDLYTESGQTLQGSFSAVSTPLIVRVGSFFSVFRDLQDFQSFAPLRIQNFSENLLHFFRIFTKILQNFDRNFFRF